MHTRTNDIHFIELLLDQQKNTNNNKPLINIKDYRIISYGSKTTMFAKM